MEVKRKGNRALKVLSLVAGMFANAMASASFEPMKDFGDNPGDLTASYLKSSVPSNAVVVLLHGCVQNGEQLAKQGGFYELAKANHFNLLVPQQHSANNIKDCFNWFSPQDTSPDSGEMKSIVEMIQASTQGISSPRIFVVGLSAGGAMAAGLLSQHPNMFEAGAIVAGLAFPCADNLTKAISCMRNGPSQTPEELAQLVNNTQKDKKAKWPSLSIWTGSKDQIVNPINAQYLAKQWLMLIGESGQPTVSQGDGYKRSLWAGNNTAKVELVELGNLGHGLPVNPEQMYGGEAGPFLLNSPLPSAVEITRFWQLLGENQASNSQGFIF